MVEAEPDLATALSRTQALIEQGHAGPIFEATFSHDGVLVRVDILSPDGEGGWRLAEVKSTTGVKAYHHSDLATQVWVLTNAGLKLSAAVIRHIDTGFVLERKGDYRGLFCDAPLLESLVERVEARDELIREARRTLSDSEPAIDPGPHCRDPFDCEFSAHCGKDLPAPPQWPIALLPRTGARIAARWAEHHVHDLNDVPEASFADPIHDRIHRATRSGKVFLDVAGANEATAFWAFPRAHLDFETIAPPAPRWVGTRAYQAISFQFSCHVEQSDGSLRHDGFLSLDGEDPRRACAEALVALLGRDRAGCIVAYNAAFERRCVRELADHAPDLAPELLRIEMLIVDLLPVTRKFYYHREQRGSWSIKAVLPTIAPELSYESLKVADGQAAQRAWLEAISSDPSSAQRDTIRAALEAYCRLDTLAMVKVLRALTGRSL